MAVTAERVPSEDLDSACRIAAENMVPYNTIINIRCEYSLSGHPSYCSLVLVKYLPDLVYPVEIYPSLVPDHMAS